LRDAAHISRVISGFAFIFDDTFLAIDNSLAVALALIKLERK
jgi:hypothetical protein